MAKVISFGKLTVTTAGTPIVLTATATPCYQVVYVPIGGQPKIIPMAGGAALAELLAPAAGPIVPFVIDSDEGDGDPFDASLFGADAGTSGGQFYAFALQH
jgi:hypothetical protein